MLKKTVSLLLTMVLTSSCAFGSFENEYFEFYQEAFKRKCIVFPVPAYFSRLEPEIAGYCIPGFGILINEDRWASLGVLQKKELIYHELAHCTLGLEHSEPGLMAPRMHPEAELKKNWDAWLELLFTSCSKPAEEVSKPK
jgi:hypothetical protein